MNLYQYALHKAMEGESGSDVKVEPLTVTENGVFSESGVAYSPVEVDVDASALVYGTRTITSNGTYDVTYDRYASVNVSGGGSRELVSLIDRTITSIENSEVTQVGEYAFFGCSSLSNISFPNCISVGQYAFTRCVGITSIYLPNCTFISANAFNSTTNLTTVSLPVCETIGNSAFYSCSQLSSLTIPNCKSIYANAFRGAGITDVSAPLCTQIMTDAFSACSKLQTAYFPAVVSVYSGAFCGCSSLTSINLAAAKLISDVAFARCVRLQSIDLPNCSLVKNNAFSPTNLSYANLPVCTSIGTACFSSCSKLETINLPLCEFVMPEAFSSCVSLASIDLPRCTYLGASAFLRCYRLKTVSLPVFKGTIYPSTFAYCSNLTSLYLLGSSMVNLSNVNAFVGTPISNYTTSTGGVYGSIFVRESLYNSFITATNWSTYSSRIVSLTDAQIEALG